ncbi:hypothetical protein ACFFRR_000935 [Megaselia abdita]
MLSHKCHRMLYEQIRGIATSPRLLANYYEFLGLSKGATQSEIKQNYYKLSMLYHPDKNKNSDVAAEKFRQITQAYEVLGNFRLRKLYDKGIIHTAGSQYAQAQREADEADYRAEEKEEDPQTRFYKKRMSRSNVPNPSGRTPIYDFDEWSRNHYGMNFARKQETMSKMENQEEKRKRHALDIQTEVVMFAGIVMIAFVIIVGIMETTHDVDQTRKNKKS